MFKQQSVFKLISLYLFFIFIACKSDKQDTSKPFINIVNPNSSELLYVYTDEEFFTALYFKDNKELSQYRLLVKSDFKIPIQPDENNSPAKAFSVVYVKNIKGKEAKDNVLVKVNKYSMSGNYSLTVDCVDVSGNQAEPVNVTFSVKNKIDSVSPNILIITPAENTYFTRDTTIKLSVLFEDFRSDNNKGFVYDFTVKIIKMSNEEEVFTFSQIINKKSPQSYIQNLPVISEAGLYRIEITSRDDFNNLSKITRVFHIL